MAVRVRRLRISDYDEMIELFRLVGFRPRTRGRDSRQAFARQLRSNRTWYLGAFDGDRLVGAVLGTHDTRKGWINRLAVVPERRRAGIGSRLVRACERGLRSAGIKMSAALIEPDNRASEQLFRRLGYESTQITYVRRKLRREI